MQKPSEREEVPKGRKSEYNHKKGGREKGAKKRTNEMGGKLKMASVMVSLSDSRSSSSMRKQE